MEDKWTIDKLDGSQNWITWKFQLKHLLLAKGLWKYVDGSAVLAEGATAEQRAKHQSESQKAFSVIAMSVQRRLDTRHQTSSNVTNTSHAPTCNVL